MKKLPHLGFARKYRPQRFEEVVGQEAVATTLRNAVETGQVGHAYLFFGPRGVGKTTSARILAKALNCAQGPTPKPCGKCAACTEIAAGSSIDVLELDAASNTQVDKIREMIIETVSLAPSRDRRKIFVIDEVHMLSTSSFNALLKTLEEPPAHVVFVLATTELAKIPPTIVSRCQRFRFRPIPRDVTVAHLKKLAKSEKIKVEDGGLRLIARASGGALRDAISLLEQACAFTEGGVTADDVSALMGTLPAEFLLGIVGAVLDKDAKKLAGWLGRVMGEGFDPTQLLRDLRERLQELYLHRLGVGGDAGSEWAELAKPHPPETFSFLLRRVNRTLEQMRGSDSPQIAFELGLYGMLESAHDLRQWVARLEALEARLTERYREEMPLPDAVGKRPASGEAAQAAPAPGPAVQAAPVPPESADAPPARAKAKTKGPVPVENIWPAVLTRLRGKHPALASGLEGSRLLPDEGDGGTCRLIFKQPFNMELARGKQGEIERELKDVTGKPLRLKFEVSKEAPAKKPHRSSRKKEEAEGWVDASEDGGPAEDTGVKKVLDAFGGRVRQVKKKKP